MSTVRDGLLYHRPIRVGTHAKLYHRIFVPMQLAPVTTAVSSL